jgi:hypothetical protein
MAESGEEQWTRGLPGTHKAVKNDIQFMVDEYLDFNYQNEYQTVLTVDYWEDD